MAAELPGREPLAEGAASRDRQDSAEPRHEHAAAGTIYVGWAATLPVSLRRRVSAASHNSRLIAWHVPHAQMAPIMYG
jgi:hypothetical protein